MGELTAQRHSKVFLRNSATYLASELVARESEDDQTLVFVLLVELLKTSILLREAALGGNIDDEDDLAFKLAHGNLGMLLVFGLEGEKVGHRGLLSHGEGRFWVSLESCLAVGWREKRLKERVEE